MGGGGGGGGRQGGVERLREIDGVNFESKHFLPFLFDSEIALDVGRKFSNKARVQVKFLGIFGIR